jgi:hypothetical protein
MIMNMVRNSRFGQYRPYKVQQLTRFPLDSEGLGADGEEQYNARMEDKGEWEDEREEIAAG